MPTPRMRLGVRVSVMIRGRVTIRIRISALLSFRFRIYARFRLALLSLFRTDVSVACRTSEGLGLEF